ncbi:hypothetical protein BD324DRAFT_578063, partial [Kockovaella imperatae]
YVTGGSQGLGRALAKWLVQNGASDVVIVARSVDGLKKVLEELEVRVLHHDPIRRYVSADLITSKGASEALEEAQKRHGRYPDHYFLCAGYSRPRYFIDHTPEELQGGLDATYWTTAWTAHTACKAMVANRIKGRIVMVGSFLSYTAFVGYTSYSPGKYAVRGLADALRSEMLLHDITVNLFLPGGIDTPGYEVENSSKPAPTKKLEEGDTLITAEECVNHMVRGLQRGYYQSTTMFVSELMRMGSRGGVPGNNPIKDFFMWLLAGIGMPIWVFFMDYTVKGFRKNVQRELEQKGYYKRAT